MSALTIQDRLSRASALELAHGVPPEPRAVDPDPETLDILADAPSLARLPALDLSEEWLEPDYLRGRPLAELVSEIEWAASDLKEQRLKLGDLAIALVAREGEGLPTKRAQVLAWIVSRKRVDPDELWLCIRVAKQFPEPTRAEFALKSWTWLQWLTDHTAFLGTPTERRPKVLLLAQAHTESTFAAMKAQIRELKAACEGSLTNQTDDEEPPHPALVSEHVGRDAAATPQTVSASVDRDGQREPVEAFVDEPRLGSQAADATSDWRQRVERLEQLLAPERLTDGLLRKFKDAEPGTYSQMVDVVVDHLRAKLGGQA